MQQPWARRQRRPPRKGGPGDEDEAFLRGIGKARGIGVQRTEQNADGQSPRHAPTGRLSSATRLPGRHHARL